MKETVKRKLNRNKRKLKVRSKISGTTDRPRVSVYKSTRHFSAQVIDDSIGKTLLSVSTFAKDKSRDIKTNKETCAALGKELAEACKSKNVNEIVFDKNGFAYHGRIKAFADGAREAGLKF